MTADTLLTEDEIERQLAEAVRLAGGAKKWLRQNRIVGYDHILHMFADGRAATLPRILTALGYQQVTRYAPISGYSGPHHDR